MDLAGTHRSLSLWRKKHSVQAVVITWLENYDSYWSFTISIFSYFSILSQLLHQGDLGSKYSGYQADNSNQLPCSHHLMLLMHQVWPIFQICINRHYTKGLNRKSYLSSSSFPYPWNILVMLLPGKQNVMVCSTGSYWEFVALYFLLFLLFFYIFTFIYKFFKTLFPVFSWHNYKCHFLTFFTVSSLGIHELKSLPKVCPFPPAIGASGPQKLDRAIYKVRASLYSRQKLPFWYSSYMALEGKNMSLR